MRFLFFLVLFAFSFLSLPVYAEPQVRDRTTYYSISGGTIAELATQIADNGPEAFMMPDLAAYTEYQVWPAFRLMPARGGCKLIDIEISIDVHYHMPQWSDFEKASPELQQKWTQYYTNLKTHEDGHRLIGVKSARAMEEALKGLQPVGTCDEVEKKANELLSDVASRYAAMVRRYDAKTGHGRTQGAVLGL